MLNVYQTLTLAGIALVIPQLLAALPWLYALDPDEFGPRFRRLDFYGLLLGVVAVGGAVIGLTIAYLGDSEKLQLAGMIYASVLHLQLGLDVVVGLVAILLTFWPRGGTVAFAAFREGYRQPMFWLLAGGVSALLAISTVIPYFTFGDDFKMMKQLGFDMVMLATVLFAVLASSLSITEEIEGRTAVTLMSKPVTRAQFLLGKYVGVLLASYALTILLGWVLNWALYIQPSFTRLEISTSDPLVQQMQAQTIRAMTSLAGGQPALEGFLAGVNYWMGETLANALGLALGFGQVMVLLAIACSLATRLPMVVNLVVSLGVYFLGNLAPILVEVTKQFERKGTGGSGIGLVQFLVQLFDYVLPALEFFSTSQVYIREQPLQLTEFAWYVASVGVYASIYSAMALLLGLVLFEDRDLA